jgi:proteasome lid subunit RPN8/RPN11
MPAEICIGRQALTVLHRVLDAAAPEEGCALLLGYRETAATGPAGVLERGALWRLRRVWPCRNVWEPVLERRRRFLVDPREQLHAQQWTRAHGLEVLGSVHSHPEGESIPSSTDRLLAVLPTLMLIRGGLPAPGPTRTGEHPLGCWWIEQTMEPRLLPWRMED